MKRRWVALIAVMAVCGAVICSAVDREKTISVNTITLESKSVDRTITCDGVIEAGEKTAIFVDTSCYIDEVVAQKGMYVQEGDVLAHIDKAATKASGKMSHADTLVLSTMSEEIRAPKSGIILKIDATEGAWMEKTAACAVIAPCDSIRVRIAIREKHLPLLHSGLQAMISGDALSKDHYPGVLTEISSTAQSLEGGGTVVEGVVEFDDLHDDPSLRIGVNTKVKIVVESVDNGIVIPYDAVSVTDQSQSYVYMLSDGAAEKYMLSANDQLSSGILVQDDDLVGKTIIAQVNKIDPNKKVRYTALEESE